MGASWDCIEPNKIESCITNTEAMWTYLKQGGLIPFMEGMGGHNDHVSLKFVNSWDNKMVNINGATFEMTKELVVKVGGFSIEGKSWRK